MNRRTDAQIVAQDDDCAAQDCARNAQPFNTQHERRDSGDQERQRAKQRNADFPLLVLLICVKIRLSI